MTILTGQQDPSTVKSMNSSELCISDFTETGIAIHLDGYDKTKVCILRSAKGKMLDYINFI